MGFGQAQVPGERSWKAGGKRSGTNVLRNPLHDLTENQLHTWPVLTVFIGLILGTEKIQDRRTPTRLGKATGAQQIVEPLGHAEEEPLPESLTCPHCSSPVCGGSGNKKRETVKELRFCWARVLPAIGARTSRLTRRSSGVWDGALRAFCELVFLLPWSPVCWASCHFPCAGFPWV